MFSIVALSESVFGLPLPTWADPLARALLMIGGAILAVRLIQWAALSLLQRHARRGSGLAEAPTVPAFLVLLIKIVTWTVALTFVLSNLGVDVTSLVAGFGLGGIAIAFAAQRILGDVFASFAIYLDNPFRIGDFIVVGNYLGTVLNIGLRSTRIRALSGEEIVIPNSDLTAARIQNFRRLRTRRVEFPLLVKGDTPLDKARLIPAMLKQAIEVTDGAIFDRAHCKSLTKDGYVFEIVYRVEGDDYGKYMDIQQAINFRIKEWLEREGVLQTA